MLFAAKMAVGVGRARIRSVASSIACSRWNDPDLISDDETRDPVLPERALVAGEPLARGRHVEVAGEDPDPRVAGLDHVLDGD